MLDAFNNVVYPEHYKNYSDYVEISILEMIGYLENKFGNASMKVTIGFRQLGEICNNHHLDVPGPDEKYSLTIWGIPVQIDHKLDCIIVETEGFQ